MFDGIAAYMQNMKMREIYDLMKLCEEEIRSPKRENDYQELLRDQKRNGDITKEITQMRNESSSSK
jgi:predicted nucleotidyltransferase component of viral defense system